MTDRLDNETLSRFHDLSGTLRVFGPEREIMGALRTLVRAYRELAQECDEISHTAEERTRQLAEKLEHQSSIINAAVELTKAWGVVDMLYMKIDHGDDAVTDEMVAVAEGKAERISRIFDRYVSEYMQRDEVSA